MSKKCQRCQKTVYHAEEQLHDGMVFHISCFGLWTKEQQAKDLGRRNASYDMPADVQPAYYRTSDGGQGAKMETGGDYKAGAPAPAAASAAASGGAAKFCGNCGASLNAGTKFCGGCGTKA